MTGQPQLLDAKSILDNPRWLTMALIGLSAGYIALSVLLVLQGSPFGHDEAVYSLRARHFVQDSPPVFYWVAYRAPGLPVLLQSTWFASPSEPFLRLVTAAFGVPLIISTWFIGRVIINGRVALLAAVGVALTPTIVGTATQVWPDVPGAAVSMVAIAIYTWAITRERVSPWILAVPLFAFLATMLRFGAPVPITIGLIGITLWQWRVALSAWKLIATTALLTAAAMALVLFVPAITAWAQAGAPVSPYTAITRASASNDFPWYRSLIDYWKARELLIGGLAGGALVVGVVTGLIVSRNRIRERDGFFVAIGIAITTGIALVLVLHGESRYLTPVFPWLWIAASFGLRALLPTMNRRVVAGALIVITLVAVVDTYDRSSLQNDFNTSAYQPLKTASVAIDDAAPDEQCAVLSSYVSQVGWYSHCPTRQIEVDGVVTESPWFPMGPTYLLLVEGGKRQPTGETLDEYMRVSTGPIYTTGEPGDGKRQYVEVYEVDR